ncbi:helix-turn-helix domain-containing protein [Paenibacillus sp. YN15]|uniref:helix-turn-helix domain-containing protein n=1 Tax=Paenibacillus sp. YN15 TaxID=1742774 RepID=UPI000DCE9F71|nr:helix-turn-helix domain-containing protein [Paenibacillus sp. YN15]RAU91217.1 hypothetical protein DQG13_29740 [Paenibacillus sp. YN15]
MMILAKRLLKYFSLLAVLLLMITPLFYTSYALAKQSTIEQSQLRLKEGMDFLEAQIIKAQEITNILRQEDSFKRLFFLEGFPQPEYYVDMNTLHTKLKSLSLTQDMLSNVYIAFRNNPVFISNYTPSDNYRVAYGQYFQYSGMEVGQFHEMLFEKNEGVRILPAKKTLSTYYSRDYFDGITVILSNSYFYGTDEKSVMGIVLNQADILRSVMYEEDYMSHFMYMTDSADNLLLAHNYNGEKPEDSADLDEITLPSGKFMTLTYTTKKLGLKTVVGIPMSAFQKNVNSILQLVTLYIVIGTFVIIILSMLFSMKETLWLKRLLEAAAKSTNTMINTGNEYRYINNAFSKISTINQEQLDKIETLNSSVKNSVLKHLLILGVHTNQELEEAQSYFGNRFDRFCIAKLGFRHHESGQATRSIQQGFIIRIEENFKSAISYEYAVVNFHSDEVIFILFLDDNVHLDKIREQLSELIRIMDNAEAVIISIGLSPITSGIKHAKTAYQQAKYALSMNENVISGRLYTFDVIPEQTDKQTFDMTLLLKLHDALLSGEKTIVERMFADSINNMIRLHADEQEQLQAFFLFRQAVSNALGMIADEGVLADGKWGLALPKYDQVKDTIRLFHELKQTALNISEYVRMNKKSNNEKLRADILAYIGQNYGTVTLSASSIAADLLISEKYVFSFIKEQTGKSLGKYIEEVRLNHAEWLLLETDYSNGKILQLCGFGSENTFYRAFSKRHAVSPTAWREMNRK